MKGILSIWGPRALGLAAAWVVGEAAKRGLTLDPEELTVAMIATYSFLHRVISRKTNPGDAAKSILVQEDKTTVAAGVDYHGNAVPR